MRVVIKFSIPEEQQQLNLHLAAPMLRLSLSEFSSWLRNAIKYDDSLSAEHVAGLEAARTKLFEILRENNIDLDELG